MSKDDREQETKLKRKAYEKEMRRLQAELCILQDWVKHKGLRVIVVFEGRGTIQVDDVVEVLEPLKGIRVLPGKVHRVRNDGRHRLRYYVCASPGTDPTIDRAAAEPPGHRSEA